MRSASVAATEPPCDSRSSRMPTTVDASTPSDQLSTASENQEGERRMAGEWPGAAKVPAGAAGPNRSFIGRPARGCDPGGMRGSLLLALPLLALLAPGAASACSMVARPHPPSPAQEQAAARLVVDGATAIIDGEVIRTFLPGRSPALVRMHRMFKGPQQAEFRVGMLTSCDIALMRVGERARMVLTGGPDIYILHMSTLSEAAVDRLLGSDRRVDWPYVRGDVPGH